MKTPKVLLVCAPWCYVNAPALGISLLKAALERRSIDCDIAYLSLRWSEMLKQHGGPLSDDQRRLVLHQRPELRHMAGDWLFAQCLYGKGSLEADEYAASVLAARYSQPIAEEWMGLRDLARSFIQESLDGLRWEEYSVVGFTLLTRQMLASLCLARGIKERRPGLPIVFGGPQCAQPMGAAILRLFPFVDFAVDGEADEVFPDLVDRLVDERSAAGLAGVAWRDGDRVVDEGTAPRVRDLNELAYPDFEDYFEALEGVSFRGELECWLPVEQSRGCWWGQRKKCTFCGISPAILPFRSKSGSRMLAELRHLRARCNTTDFLFCDNALDHRVYRDPMLSELARTRELSFLVEIKSNVTKEQIRVLRRAGVIVAGAGVESLNSHVLRLMDKGVSALQNVECLKWCRYFSMRAAWNILCGFPGETPEDYVDSLRIAESIAHLDPPLSMARFLLCRFSPNFERARELGLVNVRPADLYRFVFPFDREELSDLAFWFDFDYADGRKPSDYAQRLRDFVEEWKRQPRGELLHFRAADGSGRLADTRFNRLVDKLELDPFENSVYESCESICHRRDLAARLGDESKLAGVLERLLDLRMMVRDEERFLSVALPDASRDARDLEDRDWTGIQA